MLVNFSINDEIVRSKPVFKGGRWRDRLSAKRSIRPRPPKPAFSESNSIPLTSKAPEKDLLDKVDADKPSSKRQKIDGRQKPIPSANNASKEVISSLFTYNPSSQAPLGKAQVEEEPAKPSNAPLPDGIETFTSLGLSTSLSAHLLTKLSLTSPTAIQASTVKQLLTEDADAFIQAETGSGKTLAYLLPIVQRIMAISTKQSKEAARSSTEDQDPSQNSKLHRRAGLFAIVLSPTRELASQISSVLSLLLTRSPYIVASTVIGGEKRKSEKARLRRGANILVATPGRLADHLDNTEVLDVSQVRWLVLDEGDRLMELGFEEEIRGIVEKLEKRRAFGREASDGNREARNGGDERMKKEGLPNRRITVLCSATMKMTVQRLGEISLKDAVHIKAEPEPLSQSSGNTNGEPKSEARNAEKAFQAPAQLKQSYIIVPSKQRLVTLAALLKHTFARRGSVMKVIVFLSCADSVDFHFEVFARNFEETPTDGATKPSPTSTAKTISSSPSLTSNTNPSLTIYRMHGSLPQSVRTSTLKSFSHSMDPTILLCTDVASRGLDLPNIDLVIEYDPPFSADDHLHRVGRTARAGKAGRAECFLMPGGEEGYVKVLKEGVTGGKVNRHDAEEFLKKGFAIEKAAKNPGVEKGAKSGGVEEPKNWEEAATEFQLEIERWVIDDGRACEMARKAYVSHVRAYATHVAHERGIFDVKSLHLGHLAKAFALRERPGNMGRGKVAGAGGTKSVKRQHQPGRKRKAEDDNIERATAVLAAEANGNANPSWRNADIDAEAPARRMRSKMKEHMAVASEFNIG